MPAALIRTVDKLARRSGISRNELIRLALLRCVERNGEGIIQASLDELYGRLPERACMDPAMDCLQLSSLPEEIW